MSPRVLPNSLILITLYPYIRYHESSYILLQLYQSNLGKAETTYALVNSIVSRHGVLQFNPSRIITDSFKETISVMKLAFCYIFLFLVLKKWTRGVSLGSLESCFSLIFMFITSLSGYQILFALII